jgi:hypothetical protein
MVIVIFEYSCKIDLREFKSGTYLSSMLRSSFSLQSLMIVGYATIIYRKRSTFTSRSYIYIIEICIFFAIGCCIMIESRKQQLSLLILSDIRFQKNYMERLRRWYTNVNRQEHIKYDYVFILGNSTTINYTNPNSNSENAQSEAEGKLTEIQLNSS